MTDRFIATQEYPWLQRARKQGRRWPDDLEAALAQAAEAGYQGWEPSLHSEEQLQRCASLVQRYGLELRSVYIGGALHGADAAQTVEHMLNLAQQAQRYGAGIVVVNPDPIAWGSREDKSDTQLQRQADALNELGRRLAGAGLRLAYHMHDAEFRAGAREFHHMLLATDPAWVGLCLDTHWIYRGTGNSQVALFDIIRLYGRRTIALHLRQSQQGTWSETLEQGDIDYPRVAGALRDLEVSPLLVLEQALETGTPESLPVVEANRRSIAYVQRVFAEFS